MNESSLLSIFSTFGDISDVQLPRQTDQVSKHRGYAFITYTQEEDAEDAMDNMNLNELHGAWLQEHNTAAQDADPQAG
ncbi:hypothetical protein MGL_1928 [Malassezia globosa CBS 7966]|uniref:RRM domain-containing protein n=1 Tax=Malassezia globosa (strain ATCC MYA-4612 / CBS 7966) TaxID=425265 RepID=A8PZL0_MALGO|nr:uncharacterized protein MGL_1928 [Malassezia globosa CBS 7966]EDP43715.1 hypothetical protein MGL_1928 [Malassezia globosa CBS 7966]